MGIFSLSLSVVFDPLGETQRIFVNVLSCVHFDRSFVDLFGVLDVWDALISSKRT